MLSVVPPQVDKALEHESGRPPQRQACCSSCAGHTLIMILHQVSGTLACMRLLQAAALHLPLGREVHGSAAQLPGPGQSTERACTARPGRWPQSAAAESCASPAAQHAGHSAKAQDAICAPARQDFQLKLIWYCMHTSLHPSMQPTTDAGQPGSCVMIPAEPRMQSQQKRSEGVDMRAPPCKQGSGACGCQSGSGSDPAARQAPAGGSQFAAGSRGLRPHAHPATSRGRPPACSGMQQSLGIHDHAHAEP